MMAGFNRSKEGLSLTGFVQSLRATSGGEIGVAIGLLVAAGAAFVGPIVLARDTPATVASAYFAGAARSDATAVSGASELRTDLVGSPDATLFDQRGLAAQLADKSQRPTAIRVSDPIVDGNLASAQATFRQDNVTRHLTLKLERVFPFLRLHGIWKVRVEPGFLAVQVPPAAGNLTVDGVAIQLPAGKTDRVALLPGSHVLSTTGRGLLVGEVAGFMASEGTAGAQTIPLNLTQAGTTAAAKAVAAAFATCSGQATAGPTACPQSYYGLGSPSITWTVVGDPFASASLRADPATGIVKVLGHFQMIATAVEGSRISHAASSGGYSLDLTPSGDAFSAGPVKSSTSVPDAARPAGATDQAVIDVVRAGLLNCAQSTIYNPVDCPQSTVGSGTNIKWSAVGDPAADATVAYRGDNAVFSVSGHAQLGLDWIPDLTGTRQVTGQVVAYTAIVFWDGQKPVLATIRE